MGSVTIGSDTFPIFGTSAGADSYMNGDPDLAASWAAAVTSTKARRLVKAYRLLFPLPWSPGVDPLTVQDIIDASYLLAGILNANPAGTGGPGGGSAAEGAVAEVSDTTRRVRFFYSERAAEARGSVVDALPRDVLMLISPYLRSTATLATDRAPTATGTDGVSAFSEDYSLKS